MFLSSFREDENIIYLNKARDVQHFSQNKLNKLLETRRSVCQTKQHH
jgi:hypothetical protein